MGPSWSSAATSLPDDDLQPARASGALLQQVVPEVVERGEISIVYLGGTFSHAVLKRAKAGDFRVQKDFGGRVEATTPSAQALAFAARVMTGVPPTCLYARVDIVESRRGPLLMELELIEPELYFLIVPEAADRLARVDRRAAVVLIALLLVVAGGQGVQSILNRAIEDFRAGRVEQSLSGFDRVATMSPADAPYLWQRGIAQYYAGRFGECRDMFVSHRTVNPDDVENAAWHFLCVARAESPEAARTQILPVGPDARLPMREVYQMFQGRMTQAQVMKAAGTDSSAQFFARLYIGLYLEATGAREAGRAQIEMAAEARFARVGGYMHDVARVHMQRK